MKRFLSQVLRVLNNALLARALTEHGLLLRRLSISERFSWSSIMVSDGTDQEPRRVVRWLRAFARKQTIERLDFDLNVLSGHNCPVMARGEVGLTLW